MIPTNTPAVSARRVGWALATVKDGDGPVEFVIECPDEFSLRQQYEGKVTGYASITVDAPWALALVSQTLYALGRHAEGARYLEESNRLWREQEAVRNGEEVAR